MLSRISRRSEPGTSKPIIHPLKLLDLCDGLTWNKAADAAPLRGGAQVACIPPVSGG